MTEQTLSKAAECEARVRALAQREQVIPPEEKRYYALELTPPEQVRCVILGQDPYPNPEHAMGLAFSVPAGTGKLPPSLKNIYKEVQEDTGTLHAGGGDLTLWAKQGVLLLNTVLSVTAGSANSHARIGWQEVTTAIIEACLASDQEKAFILWGKKAEDLIAGIPGVVLEVAEPDKPVSNCTIHYTRTGARHPALRSPHPSPLAAYRGFFGSRPFSWANSIIEENGYPPIAW